MTKDSMNREAGRGFPGRTFQRERQADQTGTRQQIGDVRRNGNQSKAQYIENATGYPGMNGNSKAAGGETCTRFFA